MSCKSSCCRSWLIFMTLAAGHCRSCWHCDVCWRLHVTAEEKFVWFQFQEIFCIYWIKARGLLSHLKQSEIFKHLPIPHLCFEWRVTMGVIFGPGRTGVSFCPYFCCYSPVVFFSNWVDNSSHDRQEWSCSTVAWALSWDQGLGLLEQGWSIYGVFQVLQYCFNNESEKESFKNVCWMHLKLLNWAHSQYSYSSV